MNALRLARALAPVALLGGTTLGLLAASACSGSGDGGGGSTNHADGGGCPEGFAPKDGEPTTCVEIAPAGDCPAGTAPFIGSTDCAAVGWKSACPDGFVRDPSGWGCTDQTPASACDGTTRESLHQTSCVPLGDCNATPPAGALIVDLAAAPDATHFHTIADALAAATSGGTVWVTAGSYTESLIIAKPLTLAGVCAAQVTVSAPPSTTVPGIQITRLQGVTVSGLTLRGHSKAVAVTAGSDATLNGLFVDQSIGAGIYVEASHVSVQSTKIADTAVGLDGKWGWGIAAGLAATVKVDDSTIVGGVDGVFAASSGTVVTLQSSVIARQAPTSGTRSSGVDVGAGGKIVVQRSVIKDVAGDGAVVSDQGGHAEVSESVLRGTRVQGSQARGHGVVAIAGGELSVTSSAIVDSESVSLDSQNTGSKLTVTDTVVRGPQVSHAVVDTHLKVQSDKSGIGATITDHGALTLDGVAILGAWGFGLYAQTSGTVSGHHVLIDQTQDLKTPEPAGGIAFAVGATSDQGGKISLVDSTILHGRLAGAAAGAGGTIDVQGSLFKDIGEAVPLGTGAGLSVGEGGQITATTSAVVHTSGIGVLAVNRGNSTISMTDCTVHGVHKASTGFGHGAMGGPQTTFTFERTAFYDNEAVALGLAGGSARVHASSFSGNAIALHVQDGSYLVEGDADGDLGEGELRVSTDTRFQGNGTKVGTDALPLPVDPLN